VVEAGELMGRATRLLGRPARLVRPVFEWPDRTTLVVESAGERFLVKIDADVTRLAHEAFGQRQAGRLGVPVAELYAAEPGALLMRFVEGVSLADFAARDAVVETGRWLRRLHDHGATTPDYDGHERWSDAVAAWLAPELDGCLAEGLVDGSLAAKVHHALDDARDALDAAPPVWCHGDFQAAHVLADPFTNAVTAFLDFADHRTGEPGWDIAVFTLYDEALLDPLLAGYDASPQLRASLERTLPLYRALRLLGSVRWLIEHDHPAVSDHLARIDAWRQRADAAQ
jgi:aminoglycoside phosphotransferase (APT) family kinase protein